MANKLQEEKTKFETLLSGRQDIEEQKKRRTEKMVDDKAVVLEQQAKLDDLKARIDEEQKLCDEQTAELANQTKLNRFEENNSRDLNQKNAALTAKLEFIEQGYDYKGNVQGMNLEVFRQIMQTNQNVNDTVSNFVGKLDTTK